MLPRIFGEDLFDDFFNDDFMMRPMRNTVPQMMKTDVRELDGAYELDMDLPGFKKEDIKVDLKDGTLTISAARNAETNEKAVLRRCKSICQADRNAHAYGRAAGDGNARSDRYHAARSHP